MEPIKLFLQDSNIDIKNDFINKYLQGVSDELKNNPQLDSQLYSAICLLTRRGLSREVIPPMELVIFPDGRGFEIRSGIRPSPDCGNENLKNNKNYDKIRFSVDDKGTMEVLKSNGTFYKFDDYMKIDMSSEYREKLSVCNSHDTPTIISTYHDHRSFLPNGIEVEHSMYSDLYPLGSNFESEQELKNQTMIHAPRKWNFNLMPDSAPYEFMPYSVNAHRFINGLGLVTAQSRRGKNGNVNASVHAANTEYPDLLSYAQVPVKVYSNGQEMISPDYQKYFPGMKLWEIEKEVNLSFLRGIDTSKTRDIKPEVYSSLKQTMQEQMEKRYQIDPSELSEERSK